LKISKKSKKARKDERAVIVDSEGVTPPKESESSKLGWAAAASDPYGAAQLQLDI
jgi:hypothetical protein